MNDRDLGQLLWDLADHLSAAYDSAGRSYGDTELIQRAERAAAMLLPRARSNQGVLFAAESAAWRKRNREKLGGKYG